jgi:ribonuclease Z
MRFPRTLPAGARATFLITPFAVLIGVCVVALAGCVDWLPRGLQDKLMQSAGAAAVDRLRYDVFDDGDIHVIVLGSGTPQPGTGRLPAATAVIYGERFLVIDAGEGAGRQIADLGLPLHRVTDVLITHFHSDHIAGLGQLLNQSWNDGRTHPIVVHGPVGIEEIMQGFAAVYAADIGYRSAGAVEHNDPELALAEVRAFATPPSEKRWLVEETGDLRIDAFRVDHGHIDPAVGYRIEAGGRVVVVSGDTRASPLMVEAARGADLLVHEAVNTRMVLNGAIGIERAGRPVEAARARAIIDYHADTLEVARVAAEAGVAHLLLTHLIPVPVNRIAERVFLDGMDDLYEGLITLAQDGTEVVLPEGGQVAMSNDAT